MKFLLVLLVVVIGLWVMLGRTSRRGGPTRTEVPRERPAPSVEPMQACAHCGVHVPEREALRDAASRPYCSEAHRTAGPR